MAENYRVSVVFDSGRQVFVARAPELSQCVAEGASRAEAIAQLEDEIAAQVATIRDAGGDVPVPVDDHIADNDEPGGEVTLRITPSLFRELRYQARVEDVTIDALVAELLAESLALRSARDLGRGRPRSPRRSESPDRGNQRGGYRRGPGYQSVMDDKASFLEYVRGLENPGRGGGPRRGPRKRGRPRGGNQ